MAVFKSASLGFSRLGKNFEYVTAIKSFLNGESNEQELFQSGHYIRKHNLELYLNAGIDIIPSNDFSWSDHVWDTSILVGNIPRRYYWEGGLVPTDIYFASIIGHRKDKFEVPAMEQRPWFNTKYYYTVPEFQDNTDFIQSDNKIVQHYIEAKNVGCITRPILLGPMSYILLGKIVEDEDCDEDFKKFDILDEVLTVYKDVFVNLKRIGVKSIQIDEPYLSLDLSKTSQKLYEKSYNFLRKVSDGMHITLTTGFGSVGNNTELVTSLPVDCIHLDLHSNPEQIDNFVKSNIKKELSLGLVDGQNVFINNIEESIKIAEYVAEYISSDIQISTNCSLLHCPIDSSFEVRIPYENRQFLAYGKQKLEELSIITGYLNGKVDKKEILRRADLYNKLVGKSSIAKQEILPYKREVYKKRIDKQKKNMGIGCFPLVPLGKVPCYIDTKKIEKDRDSVVQDLTKKQQPIFDILSTCEIERSSENIDYFATFCDSLYVNTDFGHIQTNGFVTEKPPIMFGDFTYKIVDKALSSIRGFSKLTKKPIKYRVFGPVTTFHRSFIFEKIDKKDAMLKFAKFTNNIIKSAEQNGAKVIQIDEFNIREQMPQRVSEFSLNLSGLRDIIKSTYSDISDNINVQVNIGNSDVANYVDDLDLLDTDVLIVSACRTNFDNIKHFVGHKYQGDIAIGIYDPFSLHSPTLTDMQNTIKMLVRVFDIEKIWITFDANTTLFYNPTSWEILQQMYEAVVKSRERFGE